MSNVEMKNVIFGRKSIGMKVFGDQKGGTKTGKQDGHLAYP